MGADFHTIYSIVTPPAIDLQLDAAASPQYSIAAFDLPDAINCRNRYHWILSPSVWIGATPV